MAEEHAQVLGALSDALVGAVETAQRSVVRVEARQRLPASGIVWTVDGLVVSADHAVERDEGIQIGLAEGTATARVVGRDPTHDIALLRLDGGPVRAAERAAGSELRVGQVVLAVARPGEDGPQVSWGVVSAIGGPVRTRGGGVLGGFVRTGVTMYPGFSGAALVDVQGRVVGFLSSHLGGDGGMAIPGDTVSRVVDALQQHGRVRRAYLGFRSQPVPLPAAMAAKLGRQQESGLLVLSVESGSPAEAGGLLIGDIVAEVGGQTVQTPDDLQAFLGTLAIGTPTQVKLLRGGEPVSLSITPGDRPQ